MHVRVHVYMACEHVRYIGTGMRRTRGGIHQICIINLIKKLFTYIYVARLEMIDDSIHSHLNWDSVKIMWKIPSLT